MRYIIDRVTDLELQSVRALIGDFHWYDTRSLLLAGIIMGAESCMLALIAWAILWKILEHTAICIVAFVKKFRTQG